MPHHPLGHALAPGFSSSANAPKNPSTHDSRCREPAVKRLLNPVWDRNGPNVPTLPNQVNNRPMVFAPLEPVKGQFGEFPTTQPAAQQNREKRSVALTFESLGPWRLPEMASLL